jgi:hypothetical protein
MDSEFSRTPVYLPEDFSHLFGREFSTLDRRRVGSWVGLGQCWAYCIKIVLLLLFVLNENVVLGRKREERHAVVKPDHIGPIPWAKGRQLDPGVGRFWRHCHAQFLKEIQVRALFFNLFSAMIYVADTLGGLLLEPTGISSPI